MRGLDGGEGGYNGGGEGEVEGVACDSTTLIKAVCLEIFEEGGAGLDEGRARDRVE